MSDYWQYPPFARQQRNPITPSTLPYLKCSSYLPFEKDDDNRHRQRQDDQLATLQAVLLSYLLVYHTPLCPIVLLLLYWREMMNSLRGRDTTTGTDPRKDRLLSAGPIVSPLISKHTPVQPHADDDELEEEEDEVQFDGAFYPASPRLSPTPTSSPYLFPHLTHSPHHNQHPHHAHHHHPTSSGGSGSSSPSTDSKSSYSRPRSAASTTTQEMGHLDTDDELLFTYPRHTSTPSRTAVSARYSLPLPPRPPPPPPAPHSLQPSSHHLTSTTSSSITTTHSTSNTLISMSAILDVFQHSISEPQAWALIYQSVQSISSLIDDFEQSTDRDSPEGSFSSTGETLELLEIESTSQLFIDCTGAVHPSTWTARCLAAGTKERTVAIKSSTTLNCVVAYLASVIYEAITFQMIRKPTSANTKPQTHRNSDSSQKSGFLETNLDEETDEDEEEEDYEPDINKELESLLITMLKSKDSPSSGEIASQNAATVDEGIADSDEEDSTGSSPSGLMSILAKSAIPAIVKRCQVHYDELRAASLVASSNDDAKALASSCPILLSLLESRRAKEPITASTYYRSVVEHMLDEYGKLKQLLKQLCEVRDEVDGGGTGAGLPGAFRRSSRLYYNKNRQEAENTENLKIWAQTWIKVMSELRFGVHLKHTNREEADPRSSLTVQQVEMKPFEALLRQIRGTTREQLKSAKERRMKHSLSMPALDYRLAITREVIVEKRNSLKPASRRVVKELPPAEPCLHEKLMAEIVKGRKLAKVKPIVKPDIVELFFKEREFIYQKRLAQSRSFPRVKSALILSGARTPDYYLDDSEMAEDGEDSVYLEDLSTSTSSLCRASSVNSNHRHTFSQAHRSQQQTAPESRLDGREVAAPKTFMRRFRSMNLSKSSKRKNQGDDILNTSLPRPVESTLATSTPYIANLNSNANSPNSFTSPSKTKDRRFTKKSKHYEIPSIMSTSVPSASNLLSAHSPIPSSWTSRPSYHHNGQQPAHFRPISYPSSGHLPTTSTPLRCLRHQPKLSVSNASFIHTVHVPCTCPAPSFSPLGSSSSINQLNSTTPTANNNSPRLLNSFEANAYLRRSFVKKPSSLAAASSSPFEHLSSVYSSMRRSSSVMFSNNSATKERTQSSSSKSSSSRFSFSNLFSKLVPSIGASSPSKVKRE